MTLGLLGSHLNQSTVGPIQLLLMTMDLLPFTSADMDSGPQAGLLEINTKGQRSNKNKNVLNK